MLYVFFGIIGLLIGLICLGGLVLAFLPSAALGKLEKKIEERNSNVPKDS